MAGIVVDHVKLKPVGAQMILEMKGFRRCKIAYGHHTMHHIITDGSGPKPTCTVPGCVTTCSPVRSNATAR
jgi:hypothetical protein